MDFTFDDETVGLRRLLWRWTQEWESDLDDLAVLCDGIREFYNKEQKDRFVRLICEELLAKENLPVMRKAELQVYLAGIAFEDLENQWEECKIHFMEAEHHLVDQEAWVEAHGESNGMVKAIRKILDGMRGDMLEHESKVAGDAQKTGLDEPAPAAEPPKAEPVREPFKNPAIDPEQVEERRAEKSASTPTSYKQRLDFRLQLDNLQKIKEARLGAYALEAQCEQEELEEEVTALREQAADEAKRMAAVRLAQIEDEAYVQRVTAEQAAEEERVAEEKRKFWERVDEEMERIRIAEKEERIAEEQER